MCMCTHVCKALTGDRRGYRPTRGPARPTPGLAVASQTTQLSILLHTHGHHRLGIQIQNPSLCSLWLQSLSTRFLICKMGMSTHPGGSGEEGGCSTWCLRRSSLYRVREGVSLGLTNSEPCPSHPAICPSVSRRRGLRPSPTHPGEGGQLHAAPLHLPISPNVSAAVLSSGRQPGGQTAPRAAGGWAGRRGNRPRVSFIISCFNFHSAQILHPA